MKHLQHSPLLGIVSEGAIDAWMYLAENAESTNQSELAQAYLANAILVEDQLRKKS